MCSNCNSIRLTGKTLQTRQADSSKKYQENYRLKNSGKEANYSKIRLNTRTPKEGVIKNKLSEIKQGIRLKAIQNNEYFCKGCGTGATLLDCSHILSVGQFKALELIEDNIQLMCRDGRNCHVCWESGPIEEQIKLHCFADNLIFIQKHDTVTFNKFLTRLEEYSTTLVEGRDPQYLHLVNTIINKVFDSVENN